MEKNFPIVESSSSESDSDSENENFEGKNVCSSENHSEFECDKLSQEMKRSLSFSSQEQFGGLKKLKDQNDFTIDKLYGFIPKWGGFVVNEQNFQNIEIVNTCTIDYFLLALWVTSKISFKVSNKYQY